MEKLREKEFISLKFKVKIEHIMKLKLKRYNSIGLEELNAARKVISTGKLSEFVAGNTGEFYGGSNIQKLEKYLRKFYNVKYAITVNSLTSGLIAIVGSLDVEPGDEQLSLLGVCATSTAILQWNCILLLILI